MEKVVRIPQWFRCVFPGFQLSSSQGAQRDTESLDRSS
jgi:hypothetical protein